MFFCSFSFSRWWQLKYLSFSPRKLGKINQPILTCAYFFRWVGEKPPNQLWSSHGFYLQPDHRPSKVDSKDLRPLLRRAQGGLEMNPVWREISGEFLMVETTGVPQTNAKTIEICHIDTYIWSYMPIYDLICICMHLMFLFLQKNGDASSKVWFFHSHVSFRGCIWSKRTAGIIQHGSEPPLRIPTPSLACSQDSSQWRRALGKVAFRSIVDV